MHFVFLFCLGYILNSKPKSMLNELLLPGMHFTKDGKYMALAERRDCKDFISVFACNTWQLVKVSSYINI